MCLVQNNPHWVILVYLYIILLFSHPAIFKQIISLKPILSQHNPNNWLYIGHWSIANMLHQLLYHYWVPTYKSISQVPMASQYWPNISWQDIANANIANGNLILSQCGLTRERQCQYRQWKTNVGPIYSCCLEGLSSLFSGCNALSSE